MPRTARVKSKSGIYHIMMRGINRNEIFRGEEDNNVFIETLRKYKETCEYKLYAYCLMGNHLHLLLKEGKEPLGIIMRRIGSSYVLWYNKKYNRIGYLFQDRFRSEPVEDDKYFLVVLRYILRNPVKTSMVARVQDYKWSNYLDYVNKGNNTDTGFALDLFHKDRGKAITGFIEFVNMENDDRCLDLTDRKQITDDDAVKIIKNHCKIDCPLKIREFETNRRNSCLKELRGACGLSVRQIERLTGIGRGIIQRQK